LIFNSVLVSGNVLHPSHPDLAIGSDLGNFNFIYYRFHTPASTSLKINIYTVNQNGTGFVTPFLTFSALHSQLKCFGRGNMPRPAVAWRHGGMIFY
jgi:hypothetical protein